MWLPLAHPLLGTWPATPACALTGNRTSNPLLCSEALNPLSHTSQGKKETFETNGKSECVVDYIILNQYLYCDLITTLSRQRTHFLIHTEVFRGKGALCLRLMVKCLTKIKCVCACVMYGKRNIK